MSKLEQQAVNRHFAYSTAFSMRQNGCETKF